METRIVPPKRIAFHYFLSYAAPSTGSQPPQMNVLFRNPSPKLAVGPGETEIFVTIDSGADVTQLPIQFADRLGVDVSLLKPESSGTVVKNVTVDVYEKVWLSAYLCCDWVKLPVKFYMNPGGAAVLGRAGAFERLQIAFIDKDKVIYANHLKAGR